MTWQRVVLRGRVPLDGLTLYEQKTYAACLAGAMFSHLTLFLSLFLSFSISIYIPHMQSIRRVLLHVCFLFRGICACFPLLRA